MAGEPIGEPITMGGGFVMNTKDEIRGRLQRLRQGPHGQPHCKPLATKRSPGLYTGRGASPTDDDG